MGRLLGGSVAMFRETEIVVGNRKVEFGSQGFDHGPGGHARVHSNGDKWDVSHGDTEARR